MLQPCPKARALGSRLTSLQGQGCSPPNKPTEVFLHWMARSQIWPSLQGILRKGLPPE